jgi:hypothetical protein
MAKWWYCTKCDKKKLDEDYALFHDVCIECREESGEKVEPMSYNDQILALVKMQLRELRETKKMVKLLYVLAIIGIAAYIAYLVISWVTQ